MFRDLWVRGKVARKELLRLEAEEGLTEGCGFGAEDDCAL